MNDAEALRLLHSMVRIRSVSGEEDLLSRFLAEVMRQHGFDSHVDGAGNVIGRIGTGPRTLALVGHIDTVPGELPVLLQDGVLHGRGAVDAKGPMASFIAAAARYASRRSSELSLLVVGCVGEEAPNSEGARYLAAGDHSPDFLVIGEPSGWDGITLGYKGSLRARIALERECGHGAHERVGAAEAAAALWERVREDAKAYGANRKKLFDLLLTRLNQIETSSDGLRELASLDLSLRLPPDLGPEAAESWLRERTEDAEVEILGALPAWSGPRTTPLHRELAAAIRGHGGDPTYKVKTGTADLNLLAPAWGCPALAYGPGDAALDHTPQEHILVDEYLRSVSILTDLLAGVASRAPEGEPVA